MEGKEAIEQIKVELAKLQSSGQAVVPINSLITYLDQVAQNAPLSLQARQLKHLSELEAYKAQAEVRIELFKAAITTAQTALKMTLLVNGGAALAVLAFLGNIVSKADQAAITQLPMLHRLSPALTSFSIGVCLGAIAAGTTYLSQSSSIIDGKRPAIASG